MENNATNEEPMRVNIKQTAKGFAYYDVTARGSSKEEVSKRLDEAIEIAHNKCKAINGPDKIQGGE